MNSSSDISRLVAMFVSVCGVVLAPVAMAQVQRSGGGGAANAQLMMQYQQASAERTQLQADNAKLKKDLDDLKKQLDAASKLAAASKAGVNRNAAELAAAKAAAEAANERGAKDLADAKSKMQELIGKFRETITQMRSVEAERNLLQQQLDRGKAAFDLCAERNYSLYQIDNEVLDRYAHQGAFSYLARVEPFTRIKRTQIDNLVLEYKERAQELRVKKADAAAKPAAPSGTSPVPPAGAKASGGNPSPPGSASGPPAAASAPAPQNGHTPSQ